MSDKPYTPKIDLTSFGSACRLLVEARLKVAPGTNGRFQPTGFPDLGPALYKGIREFEETVKTPDGKEEKQKVLRQVNLLFSDTAAALANWMEAACFHRDDYNEDCRGIPYVRVLDGDVSDEKKPFMTASVLEPHRLASPRVLDAKLNGQEYRKHLAGLLNVNKDRPVRIWELAEKLFPLDPGCVLHGVFFGDAKLDGRLRLARLVAGYIEAANPLTANYGGVKRGEVSASENIPFPKQEFTSDDICASFIIHLSTLQGYSLKPEQDRFLVLWALYKIDRFLRQCLRLRSVCEFQVDGIAATLDGTVWTWPKSDDIRTDFVEAKKTCFTDNEKEPDPTKRPGVTVVVWEDPIKPTEEPLPDGVTAEMFNLGDYDASRVEIAVPKKKGPQRGENKLALIIKGRWENEEDGFKELDKLLELNREKIEQEGGTSVENPAHPVLMQAIKKHRDKLKKSKSEKTSDKE